MKKFLTQHKTAAVIVIFLLVIVPLCVFGIVMLVGEIEQKAQKIQEETVAQENRTERLNNLPALRTQAETIRDNDQTLNVFLAQSDDDKVNLAKKIEAIAADTENSIEITTDSDVGKASRQDGAEENAPRPFVSPALDNYLALRITIEGDYNSVVAFIERLENIRYASDILSLSLTKRTGVVENKFLDAVPEGEELERITEENVEAIIAIVFYYETAKESEN